MNYFIETFEYDFHVTQKNESTTTNTGSAYSSDLNELIVRDVFVSKFHISVVILKEVQIGDNARNFELFQCHL